jgi:uncharacterized membrane protein YfcA
LGEVIVVIITALAASFLAAIAGFGGSVIMLPVLVWTVGITDAIPVLTIAQLIGNLSRVYLINTNWTGRLSGDLLSERFPPPLLAA